MNRAVAAAIVLVLSLGYQAGSSAQQPLRVWSPGDMVIQATAINDLRTWDAYIINAERAGALRLRSVNRDPALPGRMVERFQQYFDGVPIWGADIVRDSEQGLPISIFGMLAPAMTLPVEPTLDADRARAVLLEGNGAGTMILAGPQLVIVSTDAAYRLAYTAVVANGIDVSRVMVDAHTGAEIERHPELLTQAAVGTGLGVLGDQKKLSVTTEAATFFTDDRHRPPQLRTYDFRGNTSRAVAAIEGAALLATDRASDADNQWTDAGVVDAHVNIGWTYDYYYKRHGRRGLDDRDRPITTLVNAVAPQAALSLPPDLSVLVDNAFWCGECGPGGTGLMYFGSGVPANVFSVATGQTVAPLAGGLDVAAHELTHGVVDSSSRFLSGGEPGALNEGFADIIGTSVEFFYQTPGTGRGQADYLIAEDVYRALRPGSIDGIRSLGNPQAFSYPDHFSRRYTGPQDDGGVHINAGIPGHAFYLAIEGGTNRTSGLSVQGVGAANRQQIERVFYRAFTLLMPANSTFSTARVATIQASRDLFGAGGAVEQAVTQAWNAVGVFERPTLTFSFSPSAPVAQSASCSTLTPPCWSFRVTVQESTGLGLNVTAASIGFFDANQNLLGAQALNFPSVFNDCGAPGSRIPPRGTVCSDLTVSFGGRTSGFVAFAIEGRDDSTVALSFVSSLLRLAPSAGTISPTSTFLAPAAQPAGEER